MSHGTDVGGSRPRDTLDPGYTRRSGTLRLTGSDPGVMATPVGWLPRTWGERTTRLRLPVPRPGPWECLVSGRSASGVRGGPPTKVLPAGSQGSGGGVGPVGVRACGHRPEADWPTRKPPGVPSPRARRGHTRNWAPLCTKLVHSYDH